MLNLVCICLKVESAWIKHERCLGRCRRGTLKRWWWGGTSSSPFLYILAPCQWGSHHDSHAHRLSYYSKWYRAEEFWFGTRRSINGRVVSGRYSNYSNPSSAHAWFRQIQPSGKYRQNSTFVNLCEGFTTAFQGWLKHPFQGCTNQIHTLFMVDWTLNLCMGRQWSALWAAGELNYPSCWSRRSISCNMSTWCQILNHLITAEPCLLVSAICPFRLPNVRTPELSDLLGPVVTTKCLVEINIDP